MRREAPSHEELGRALRALGESATVEEAAQRYGLSLSGFRRLMQLAGVGEPRTYLRGAQAPKLQECNICRRPGCGGCTVNYWPADPAPTRKRVLIIPDVHVPYHSRPAWSLVLTVAQRWRPDEVVILGDFGDFYGVSGYAKDPKRRMSFDEELGHVRGELGALETALGHSQVTFLEGNHETRLARYIAARAPELSGVVGNTDEELDISARGWRFVPYGHLYSLGHLNFAHDVGRDGVNAPRQSVQDVGGNIVFGHTHRAGSHYESSIKGDRHVGIMMGWLGDPEAIDYKHRAKVLRESQHGFGVAHVLEDGRGWVTFVPIIGGSAIVDGVEYR